MTQTEYARHKGVELAAVKRAITEGRLPEHAIKTGSNNRKLILIGEADKFWDESTMVNNKNELRQKTFLSPEKGAKRPKASGPEDDERDQDAPKLIQIRTIKESFAAKTAQLEYEMLIGELVKKADVEKAVSDMATNIRNSLENFADKLSPLMAAETNIDKCHKILTDEIRSVLMSLSRGEYSIKAEVTNE